jgi:hypothetical protein
MKPSFLETNEGREHLMRSTSFLIKLLTEFKEFQNEFLRSATKKGMEISVSDWFDLNMCIAMSFLHTFFYDMEMDTNGEVKKVFLINHLIEALKTGLYNEPK